MSHEIYSKEVDGIRIRVMYDEDAESPRKWDNVATLWASGTHRHYDFHETAADEVLGQIKQSMPDDVFRVMCNQVDASDPVEAIQWLMNNQQDDSAYVIVPVQMEDHGGLSFSTGDMGGGWDSGTIGWMMVDKIRWAAMHGGPWSVEAARQCIEDEVTDLDNFHVFGAVGYMVEKANGCECCGHEEWEEVESCWGIYGDPEERKKELQSHVGPGIAALLEDM